MTHPLFFFRARFPARIVRCARTAVAAAALLAVSPMCFASNQSTPPQEQWVPDALVLVMAGFGSSEQVSIAYPEEISEKQAHEDLAKLALVSGWVARNSKTITASSGAPDGRPTTSSSFQTTGIVDPRAGTLKLEPFLVALKRFGKIEVIFINVPEMKFAGLKDFENEFVKITMSRQDSSYRYRAVIKDNSFDKLDLPLLARTVAEQERPAGKSGALRIAIIVGFALLGAVAAYLVAVRLARGSRT